MILLRGLLGALILCFTASTMVHAQSVTVPANDAAEIQAALNGMTEAWNRHDMKAFVSYMTDDVQWINVRGSWWKGKAEVYRQHQALHETIFKNRLLNLAKETELRLIAPGVVVATTMVPADAYTTPSGHQEPAGLNALTEVFVHRGGKWLVVEGHNTVVIPPTPRAPLPTP